MMGRGKTTDGRAITQAETFSGTDDGASDLRYTIIAEAIGTIRWNEEGRWDRRR